MPASAAATFYPTARYVVYMACYMLCIWSVKLFRRVMQALFGVGKCAPSNNRRLSRSSTIECFILSWPLLNAKLEQPTLKVRLLYLGRCLRKL